MIGRLWNRKRRASLDLVAGAFARVLRDYEDTDALALEFSFYDYIQSTSGAEGLRVWRRVYDSEAPVGEVWREACGALTNPLDKYYGVPLLPNEPELKQLRRSANAPVVSMAEKWRTLEALMAILEERTILRTGEGEELHITWPTAVWSALRHAHSVLIFDGTSSPERQRILKLLFGPDRPLRVIGNDVEDLANWRRKALAIRDATRATFCPGGKVNWARFRGPVRKIVEEIVRTVPAGRIIVWNTFRPNANALRRAWDDPTAEGADLLEPLRSRGDILRFTYFGATDTRGSNKHVDAHVTITLGDPRPNIDRATREASSFGLAEPEASPVAKAVADLGQFHARLRAVQRDEELWSIHAGELLPAGHWCQGEVTVEVPDMGRPLSATEDVQMLVARLVTRHGGQRAAAKAVGCAESMLRKILAGGKASDAIAQRVRFTAEVGAHESPVQKEESEVAAAPHFRAQPSANDSNTLATPPSATPAPPATVRPPAQAPPVRQPEERAGLAAFLDGYERQGSFLLDCVAYRRFCRKRNVPMLSEEDFEFEMRYRLTSPPPPPPPPIFAPKPAAAAYKAHVRAAPPPPAPNRTVYLDEPPPDTGISAVKDRWRITI